jgi:hypothetical protein
MGKLTLKAENVRQKKLPEAHNGAGNDDHTGNKNDDHSGPPKLLDPGVVALLDQIHSAQIRKEHIKANDGSSTTVPSTLKDTVKDVITNYVNRNNNILPRF